jgi:hypothetical protein
MYPGKGQLQARKSKKAHGLFRNRQLLEMPDRLCLWAIFMLVPEMSIPSAIWSPAPFRNQLPMDRGSQRSAGGT